FAKGRELAVAHQLFGKGGGLKLHNLNKVALLNLPRTPGFLGALGFVATRCHNEKHHNCRDLQVSVLFHLS
nr:hypothetical protein [Bacteroidales bacterium]